MKNKFKVGDKVRITKDNCLHKLPIGSVQTINFINERGDYQCISGRWFSDDECESIYHKRAILSKSSNGTFYYSLFHGNDKNIGSNRGINNKKDALDTLRNSFPDFEVVDKTIKP